MKFSAMKGVAQWGEAPNESASRLCGSAPSLARGLEATRLSLLENHGEEALNCLIALAEDVVNHGLHRKALLSHATTLTWEKLITFASLVEEYNAEWAVASMEWG